MRAAATIKTECWLNVSASNAGLAWPGGGHHLVKHSRTPSLIVLMAMREVDDNRDDGPEMRKSVVHWAYHLHITVFLVMRLLGDDHRS